MADTHGDCEDRAQALEEIINDMLSDVRNALTFRVVIQAANRAEQRLVDLKENHG